MPTTLPKPRPAGQLYDQDFFRWTEAQARAIREQRPSDVDWENVAEEIESLGKSDKREIRNRLTALLTHLLKWQFQPEQRSQSWLSTIGNERTFIAGILEDSPSLRRFPAEVLTWSYQRARSNAQRETNLPLALFPEEWPYSVDQALDDAFMPGRPWSPDDLS